MTGRTLELGADFREDGRADARCPHLQLSGTHHGLSEQQQQADCCSEVPSLHMKIALSIKAAPHCLLMAFGSNLPSITNLPFSYTLEKLQRYGDGMARLR